MIEGASILARRIAAGQEAAARRAAASGLAFVRCYCGAVVTEADVRDAAYECRHGHYFTRPEAGDSNICPECSGAGRRIGTACPECRELLPEGGKS